MARIHLSPPDMSGRERDLLLGAFDSNWVAPVGPELAAFEKELADAVGVPHAVALSSGTAGLPPTFQSGLVTLVAGTKTVTTFNLTASSRIAVTQNTPGGGTQGVKYAVPAGSRTPGSPGSFVINAVDNAGALVNTDTSTLDVIIIN